MSQSPYMYTLICTIYFQTFSSCRSLCKFSKHKFHTQPQVAQAHYDSPEQHYPTQLINYSYSKKIIRRCMGKCSLLPKLAKCTLNIALKLTFSVLLFFFAF